MNQEQFHKIKTGRGFLAALDQSGGSTPKALKLYGIPESAYTTDSEMFALMHQMRSRIIANPSFNGERILGSIIFEDTMDRQIEGRDSSEYLWQVKGVVPFLKVDKGLAAQDSGAQLMKPIPALNSLLARAADKGVFGTKMRSFIAHADKDGIKAVVDQQFELASQILQAGLVPILEPEVDIHAPDKAGAEELLKAFIGDHLGQLSSNEVVMLKLSLPELDDFYSELVNHPNVLRVVALSGGFSREEANARLARNHGMIASFSRALTEGLSVDQSDEEFTAALDASIASIFEASIT
ncbi:MAG: fructose bisphosphate aldolase [Actinobacteria bacterium]|nr:fructose bisphosphate aldolase [Actinomycetota bacterium]